MPDYSFEWELNPDQFENLRKAFGQLLPCQCPECFEPKKAVKPMEDYGGADQTLVPGRLRGFRVWNIYQGKLVPTNFLVHMPWQPGQNEAVCGKDKYLGSKDHISPDEICKCGFYSRYEYPSDPNLGTNYLSAGGALDAWGKIQLGTKGFRAQYAQITALTLYKGITSKNRDTIKSIAEAYGVPFFERPEYLKEEFPKSDVSDLIRPAISPEYVNLTHGGVINPGDTIRLSSSGSYYWNPTGVTYTTINSTAAYPGATTYRGVANNPQDIPQNANVVSITRNGDFMTYGWTVE